MLPRMTGSCNGLGNGSGELGLGSMSGPSGRDVYAEAEWNWPGKMEEREESSQVRKQHRSGLRPEKGSKRFKKKPKGPARATEFGLCCSGSGGFEP